MPYRSSIIYNEGRVVGYSAYEIYVRHALSEDPNSTPASEIEWLSSTIAMGSSMLFKVPVDNTSGYHFIEANLPANTRLAAANTILGSLFLGEAVCDSEGWAQKVTSYGPLLTNNSTYPVNGAHTSQTVEQPTSYTSKFTEIQQYQIKNYMNIVDGIVIQPGTWSSNASEKQPPSKDLAPSLSSRSVPNDQRPRIRILLSDKVETSFYILLTGFTLRTVLEGVVGLDGSTDTGSNIPEDGGFLGPAIFPWANKIVFSVPNSYIDVWIKTKYSRKLTQDGVTPANYTEIKAQTITDLDETSFTDYYSNSSAVHNIAVKAENARSDNPFNVLTVYQRFSVLPPALYAHIVDTDGSSNVSAYPVDVVSPGTVKIYKEEDLDGKSKIEKIKDLENNAPKNFGFIKDSASVLWEQNESGTEVQVADTYTSPIYGTLTSTEVMDPYFCQANNTGMPAKILLLSEPEDWGSNNNYVYWDSTSSSYVKKSSTDVWEPNKYFVESLSVWFSAVMSRRISGTVNRQFKLDCGIGWSLDDEGNEVYDGSDLETIINASYDVPSHGSNEVNRTMYETIRSSGRLNDYYFVLSDGPNFPSDSHINSFKLIPVEMQEDGSGKIDFVDMLSYDSSSNPGMLWYLPCAPAFGGDNLDLMGGYYSGWAGKVPGHAQTVQDYLNAKLNQSVLVTNPGRSVPNATFAGVDYTNWEEMYKQIKLNSVISSQYLTDGVSTSFKYGDGSGNIRDWNVSMNKVYSGYHDLSLHDLLQELKVHKRIDGKLVEHNGEKGFKMQMYIGYNRSYAEAHSDEWETIGKQDYYYPASPPGTYDDGWQESAGAVRCVIPFNTSINESNYQKSVIIPLPEAYRPDGGPQAIVNIAGDHQTRGLSLTDSSNNLYDFHGSNGTYIPPSGTVTWEDLMKILAEGKSLDLLGSDRFYTALIERLKSGDGISIQDDSEHKQLIISANLGEGTGIALTADEDGKIYITNTMPDYSNGNYTRVNDSQYILNSVNKFNIVKSSIIFEYCASTDKKTIAVRISFGGDVYAKMSDFGNDCFIDEWYEGEGSSRVWYGRLVESNRGELNHEYAHSTYTGDAPSGQQWEIGLNSDKWKVFAFRHDLHSIMANKKANIINIKFSQDLIDTLFLKSESSGNHGDRSKYRFEDTTGATSGIWNVGLSENAPRGTTWDGRASWSAACHLRANSAYYRDEKNAFDSTYFVHTDSDIAIFGFSYADGYNSQFPGSYNCNWLDSNLLNVEVGGVFRYIG